jgi:hypothetical protein
MMVRRATQTKGESEDESDKGLPREAVSRRSEPRQMKDFERYRSGLW